MGTQLFIKGSKKTPIELPRGATIPHEGDIVNLTQKGDNKEKKYLVYLVEHDFNLNLPLPVGNTLIILEEIKQKKKAKGE